MARCGCAGSVCSCKINVEGLGSIDGVGSEVNPYVLTVEGSVVHVQDSDSVNMNITGSGTDADPYVISADSISGMTPSPQAAPIGSLLMYGAPSPPTGWFLCDGSTHSTTTYAALFALIGYTFGGTGGSFAVPDLRNRFPIGVSLPGGVAGFLADDEGETDPLDRTPAHTHSQGDLVATSSGSGHTHNLSISDPNMAVANNTPTTGSAKRLNGSEHHTHSGSTALSSGGSGHEHGVEGLTGNGAHVNAEQIMPFLALHFIMKYLP